MRSWKYSYILLLLNCSIMGCQSSNFDVIHRLDGTSIAADTLTQQVQLLMDQAHVHGLSISIFNEGTLAYQHFFGYKNHTQKAPFTDTTNIYGASLSKAVFSVLAMRLVEEGILDLDKPLQDYLPKPIYEYESETRWHDDYNDLREDSLYTQITARMCLNHTSGFPNWRFFESDQKLRCKFPPGSQHWYSGEGFVYLQVVLEKLLDTPLETLAQEYIFEPLKMTHSSYVWQNSWESDFASGHSNSGQVLDKDKDNEARGGSTLETTVLDYQNFLTAVLQKKILQESSWQALFKPQFRLNGKRQFGPLSLKESSENDQIELSHTLGWTWLKSPFGFGVAKGGHGSGFQHYSILFPQKGIGVLLLSNSDNAESIFRAVLALSIADNYTPWKWKGYVPYNYEKSTDGSSE